MVSESAAEMLAPRPAKARWGLALSLSAVLLPLLGFIVGAIVGLIVGSQLHENQGNAFFSAFITAMWFATLAWAIGIVLGVAALATGITIIARAEPGRKRAVTAIVLGGIMTASSVLYVAGAWPLDLGPFV